MRTKATDLENPDEARLLSKLDKIEKDLLFDKAEAEQQWRAKKNILERDYAQAKKKRAEEEKSAGTEPESALLNEPGNVNDEAARIAAEVFAEGEDDDDEQALVDLFASLPVSEVDPLTGKTTTVMNEADGSKIVIRDFGKWSGVSPTRVLEEACRARFVHFCQPIEKKSSHATETLQ